MTYEKLAYLHLGTIAPAFFIGLWLLLVRKGTPLHRGLGRVYVILVMVSVLFSLLMPARVGPSLAGHFGWIHLLSVIALLSLPLAVMAARRGNIVSHRGLMLGVYVGGILIAGMFTLMPGRMMHSWIFAG
jgi:uncharacterized membrane protein